MMLELICRLGYKALWINNKKDLLNQALERAKGNIINCEFGTITEGKVNIGDITFSTIQTLAKIDLNAIKNEFGIIICDECFPKDTPILTKKGFKNIQKIKIGDKVLSYNHKSNQIEEKEVLNLFKKIPNEIITINNNITCTSNHPIYTKRGYVSAKELKNDDYVLLCMWEGSKKREYNKKPILSLFRKAKGLLFKRMCTNNEKEKTHQKETLFSRDITKIIFNDERKMERKRISNSKCRENDKKQSNSKYRSKTKVKRKIKRSQTNYTRWKWKRNDNSAEKNDGCSISNKSCCRICTKNKLQKRRWLSNTLQNRYSDCFKKNSNRNRWKFTQQSNSKTKRFKKRAIFKWIRVESIKIQERTSDRKFAGLCKDGYVYNIEVKDNNNYFANNILVHNCQNFSGTPTKYTQTYKVLSQLSARFKFGCTACVHRSDGLMQAGLDLIGDVAYEVPECVIADKIVRAVVQPIHTAFTPILSLGSDGIVESFASLISEIALDPERNSIILNTIRQNKGHHCIVLSDRLEQLKYLQRELGYGLMIDGSMVSKKGKEQRRAAIQKMKTGEETVLFASYSLAKEGLDIPILDRLIMASPKKDKSVIIQSVGRIERKYGDIKNPIVYDFVDDFDDDFNMLSNMYKKRKTIYRKNGNKINE